MFTTATPKSRPKTPKRLNLGTPATTAVSAPRMHTQIAAVSSHAALLANEIYSLLPKSDHLLVREMRLQKTLCLDVEEDAETSVSLLFTHGKDCRTGVMTCSSSGYLRIWPEIENAYYIDHQLVSQPKQLLHSSSLVFIAAFNEGVCAVLYVDAKSGNVLVRPLTKSKDSGWGIIEAIGNLLTPRKRAIADSNEWDSISDGGIISIILGDLDEFNSRILFILTHDSKVQKWQISGKVAPHTLVYDLPLNQIILDAIRKFSNLPSSEALSLTICDFGFIQPDQILVMVSYSKQGDFNDTKLLFVTLSETDTYLVASDLQTVQSTQNKTETQSEQYYPTFKLSASPNREHEAQFVAFIALEGKVLVVNIRKGLSKTASDDYEQEFFIGNIQSIETFSSRLSAVICTETEVIRLDVICKRGARALSVNSGSAHMQKRIRSRISEIDLEEDILTNLNDKASLSTPYRTPSLLRTVSRRGETPQPKNEFDITSPESILNFSKSIVNEYRHALKFNRARSADVESTLSGQLDRLEKINETVLENGANLNHDVRQELLFNCEKVYAMNMLWIYQKSELAQSSILNRTIQSFMKRETLSKLGKDVGGAAVPEDPFRIWFESMAESLGDFIPTIANVLTSASFAVNTSNSVTDYMQAMDLVNIIFRSAFSYRRLHHEEYKLPYIVQNSIIDWTCTLSILEGLSAIFGHIRDILKSADSNSSEIDGCWVEFCGYYLAARERYRKSTHTESLDYSITQVFESFEPRGLRDECYAIAEMYRKFGHLSILLLGDFTASQKSEHVKVQRKVDGYIDEYGDEFGFIFFEHLMTENTEILMKYQSPVHLKNYFAKTGISSNWISWINDIDNNKFSEASSKLVHVAYSEKTTLKSQIATSLAKLCYLASDSGEKQLEVFRKTQELILIQTTYKNWLEGVPLHGFAINEQDVDINLKTRLIMDTHYSKCLEMQPIYAQTVSRIIKQILRGFKSTSNELVVVLTSHSSNDEASKTFFNTAFDILRTFDSSLSTDENFFEFQLYLLWRKCYLSDPWQEISKLSTAGSDDAVMELYHETCTYRLLEFISRIETEENVSLSKFVVAPHALKFDVDEIQMKSIFPKLSDVQVHQLHKEFRKEQALIDTFVNELDSLWVKLLGNI